MLSVEPSGKILGATIHGANLTKPLSDAALGTILFAIGEFGLLRFPNQSLTPAQQLAFARQFGEIQKVTVSHIPEHPDMSVLSNIVKNGKPLGIPDAGVVWHRDMTYYEVPGFANVLHGITIPKRDGKPLGDTQFLDSQTAYDDLPPDMKERLKNARGVHAGSFYQNRIQEQHPKAKGGISDNRYKRANTSHPILMTHPISGRKVIYCDISHVGEIEGVPKGESDALLKFLNEHQAQDKYRYAYQWAEGDVVMWDNFRSLHRGAFDYRDDEPRLINRCQILSNKICDPSFMKSILAKVIGPH